MNHGSSAEEVVFEDGTGGRAWWPNAGGLLVFAAVGVWMIESGDFPLLTIQTSGSRLAVRLTGLAVVVTSVIVAGGYARWSLLRRPTVRATAQGVAVLHGFFARPISLAWTEVRAVEVTSRQGAMFLAVDCRTRSRPVLVNCALLSGGCRAARDALQGFASASG